jgi:hypothetical protein
MSEAMAVETILEADWQMQGSWTRLRYPLRTATGCWSDIDLLAYCPESQHLVIAESKVRGRKNDVFAYTAYSKQKSILDFDRIGGRLNYFRFLEHLPLACANGAIFRNFSRMVRRFTVQLVSNYYVDPTIRKKAQTDIVAFINKTAPKIAKVDVTLETTLDVFLRVSRNEAEASQGRRYGHPVIDLAREPNRYMRPRVQLAGGGAAEVRTALGMQIMEAFQINQPSERCISNARKNGSDVKAGARRKRDLAASE